IEIIAETIANIESIVDPRIGIQLELPAGEDMAKAQPPAQEIIGAGPRGIGVVQRHMIGIGVGNIGIEPPMKDNVESGYQELRRHAGQAMTGEVRRVLGEAAIVEIMPGVADKELQTADEACGIVDQLIGN